MSLSLAHLPRTARDLVDLIGLPATLRLVEEYGGQVFQVPKGRRVRGNKLLHELGEVIGADAAKKLSATHGGNYFSVPLCQRAIVAARDAQLQARFDALDKAGHSSRAIANRLAKEFRITAGTVLRASKRSSGEDALQAKSPDDRQMGLPL